MRHTGGGLWREAVLAAWALLPIAALAAASAAGVAVPHAARWTWLAVALLWAIATVRVPAE